MIEGKELFRLGLKSTSRKQERAVKALGELSGLQHIVFDLDDTGLDVLTSELIPTGTIGDVMGDLILNWASKTCPSLPEPSIKIKLWLALAKSRRTLITDEDIMEAIREEDMPL